MNNRKVADFTRSNSICPPPETALLDSVLRNDLATTAVLIRSNPKLLTYEYPFPHEKPILQIACGEEKISPDTIVQLLDLGADPKRPNEWHALHVAVTNPNSAILKTIIDRLDNGINDKVNGNNALHTLIKSDGVKDNEEVFCQHVELLLKSSIDVNAGDGKNIAPVLWAAKYNYRQIIQTILRKSIQHVDLDSHKLRNKSARDWILEKRLFDGPLPEPARCPVDAEDQLFVLIKQSREDEFIELLRKLSTVEDYVNLDDGQATLLQYSCQRNLLKVADFLLNNCADVNLTTKQLEKPPVELVADSGRYELFERILQANPVIPPHLLANLIKCFDASKLDGIDYAECLKMLLKSQFNLKINAGDDLQNTALHCALRYADDATVLALLGKGASLACRNEFGMTPIEDIKPDLLEKHLDRCVKFSSKNFDKHDFQVVFDYTNLITPKREVFHEDGAMVEELAPETAVVSYMAQATEFKHLLKHPVIVSFLFMKWQRICWLFYTNLFFYILFVASLITYIFTYFGNFDDSSKLALEPLAKFSWSVLLVTFLLLCCRELFQIAVSPDNYFTNFENLIEIILIVLTGAILFLSSPSDDTRKQLSAVVILLGAFELVLMVGQHPRLSTNVVMFKTVSINFFKLLLWYSLLIIAFALSFNVLFMKSASHLPSNQTEVDDDDEDMFTGPGKSLFKTIVMLTGEFDAGSINFHTYPITSKLIFTLFIFTITIILLNLLNGLAVSDTQTIKNDAELVGHIARAQHIAYVEGMLLGNLLPSSLMACFERVFCCCPWNTRHAFIKPLARRVCLFANMENCVLYVHPNEHGRVIQTQEFNKNKGYSIIACPKIYSGIYLDKETNQRTIALIKKQRESSVESNCNMMDIIERLYNRQVDLETKVVEMYEILKALRDKQV